VSTERTLSQFRSLDNDRGERGEHAQEGDGAHSPNCEISLAISSGSIGSLGGVADNHGHSRAVKIDGGITRRAEPERRAFRVR
jgi:hypothetical protein